MELWATWSSGRCPCSWQGGWNQMIFKVTSNPYHSMILCWGRPLTSSELWLPSGAKGKQPPGQGGRFAFKPRSWGMAGQVNCSVLGAASTSPLVAEARAEAPVHLLERWGKAVGRLGRNLSCLSLLCPHSPQLGQILARSREWEQWMSISPFANSLI